METDSFPAQRIFREEYIHRGKFHTERRGLIIFQGSGVSTTRKCRPYILAGLLRKFASYSTRESALGAGSSLRVMPATVSMVTCQVLSPRATPSWTISRPAGRDAGLQPLSVYPQRRGGSRAAQTFGWPRSRYSRNSSRPDRFKRIILRFSVLVDTLRRTWGWPWTAVASLRKRGGVRNAWWIERVTTRGVRTLKRDWPWTHTCKPEPRQVNWLALERVGSRERIMWRGCVWRFEGYIAASAINDFYLFELIRDQCGIELKDIAIRNMQTDEI